MACSHRVESLLLERARGLQLPPHFSDSLDIGNNVADLDNLEEAW